MISINKPVFDTREFLGGVLNNNIKYVLVNDKTLDKSYMSVCMNVGTFQNPKGYDGLAHFLEHMLFMGSKKYPDINHYAKKISEKGGFSNAYTDSFHTVYYFNVFDDALLEIIDIFSRFFIDPLFDNDAVNKELNAINNEHLKNINDDGWIKHQFTFDIANENSCINTFGTGSKNTLNHSDIRDKMVEFYNNHYTTDNISICIASSKNIDELKKIIDDTFGNIKKSFCKNRMKLNKPFYSNNINKTYHLKSTSYIHELSYLWEIPEEEHFIKSKEYEILGHMITQRNKDSLYFYLKNNGYVRGLNVEIKEEGVFAIHFKLTEFGFNNINFIENSLFKYLDKIKKSNVNDIALYLQKLYQKNFDYLHKVETDDLCNLIAINHFKYKTNNVYDGEHIIMDINITLNKYINDDFIRIIQSPDSFNKVNYLRTREYNVKYCELDKSKIIKKLKKNSSIEFSFDTNNEFLNIKPQLIKDIKNLSPMLLQDRQWYGGTSVFDEPSVFISLKFSNPLYFNKPKNYILTYICLSIMSFLSNDILHKPLQLPYTISFEPSTSLSCFNVSITALNDLDKLKIFINKVIEYLHNLDSYVNLLSDTYIKNIINNFKNNIENNKYLNAWEYLASTLQNKLFNTEYKDDIIIKECKKIKKDNIKKHLSLFFKEASLTSFIYGNIENNNINQLFEKFNNLYKNKIYLFPNIKRLESDIIKHPNKKEKSNCVVYFFYIGKFTPETYNLLLLTRNILYQEFFNELRTKYQLGYIVSMTIYGIRNEFYIMQRVQSDKTIEEIEEKMNEFNDSIKKIIDECNFDTFYNSVKNNLKKKDTNIYERYVRLNSEISLREFLFDRRGLLLDNLKEITKNDVEIFIDKYLNKNNLTKIIVKGNY